MSSGIFKAIAEFGKSYWDVNLTDAKKILTCLITEFVNSQETETLIYGIGWLTKRSSQGRDVTISDWVTSEVFTLDDPLNSGLLFTPLDEGLKERLTLLTTPADEIGEGEVYYQVSLNKSVPSAPLLVVEPETYGALTLYFSTNRSQTNSASLNERFGNERSDDLTMGQLKVSIPDRHKIGKLERPFFRFLEENPAKHVSLVEIQQQDQSLFYSELRDSLSAEDRSTLFLFVHGYNVSFAEAARKFAQICYDMFAIEHATRDIPLRITPLLLSWPSSGDILSYSHDRESCRFSIESLKAQLTFITEELRPTRIVLFAHSMGCNLLVEMLHELGLARGGENSALFNELILAAPDIDRARFMHVISNVRKIVDRVTLYASSKDKALKVSKALQRYARAGDAEPEIAISVHMDSIDASDQGADFLKHSYFSKSKVLSDIYSIVVNSLPPTKRFGLLPAGTMTPTYWRFKR